MKRYDLDLDETGDAAMVEDPIGDYCLVVEVLPEIEALKKELNELKVDYDSLLEILADRCKKLKEK